MPAVAPADICTVMDTVCYLCVQGCKFGSHCSDVSHMFYYHYIKSLPGIQLAASQLVKAVPCYSFQAAACNRCGQQQNSSSFLFLYHGIHITISIIVLYELFDLFINQSAAERTYYN
uniref:Uncharacterized protein n=1 Tax=Glossina austeni TaxID=7395 RepID=A0A1A9V1W2_GLOAU